MYIDILFHYPYNIIQSIPGIGEKIAQRLFLKLSQLLAYAGIDSSIYSSGKFTATTNPITKRGSSRIRHGLYLAVLCGIKSSRNNILKEFYDKKRSEGKPIKVALVTCIIKLLQLIKRKEAFLNLLN
ncbi:MULTISPECIES: transposase [Lysinibacillus]|nr:transposase [Lysinibacillus sphaericus]